MSAVGWERKSSTRGCCEHGREQTGRGTEGKRVFLVERREPWARVHVCGADHGSRRAKPGRSRSRSPQPAGRKREGGGRARFRWWWAGNRLRPTVFGAPLPADARRRDDARRPLPPLRPLRAAGEKTAPSGGGAVRRTRVDRRGLRRVRCHARGGTRIRRRRLVWIATLRHAWGGLGYGLRTTRGPGGW